MEEATRQLELLKAFTEYPRLLEHNAELERKIKELEERCQSLCSEVEGLKQVELIVGKKRITQALLKERITRIMAEQIKSQVEKQIEENKLAGRKTVEVECTQRDLNLVSQLISSYTNPLPVYFSTEEMESYAYKKICGMLEDFKNFIVSHNASNKSAHAKKPEEEGN